MNSPCKTCGEIHLSIAEWNEFQKTEELRLKKLQHDALYWDIIKAKILYYSPREISEATITELMPKDNRYDQMEQSYLKKCQELSLPNTIVHKEYPGVPEHLNGTGMMEVDWTNPDVQTAYEELLSLTKI